MDRILRGDIRRHGTDLYAVIGVIDEGLHAGHAVIVPLTTMHDQGVSRINDKYSLLNFGSVIKTTQELGTHTTWTGEITGDDLNAIEKAFEAHTAKVTRS